jgi:NADH dehydrogenase
MDSNKKPKVLVVGAGFAGVKAALELAKSKRCEVTLLSDHSHFRYYPATYRAAAGGYYAGSHIRLSNILTDGIKYVRGTAAKLDRKRRQIITEEGETYPYDILILALGSVTNYFGIKGLKEHSYNLKTYGATTRLKKHLHQQFIKNGCPDPNYVIVGGGPTGIELAGVLPAYLRKVMKHHGIKDCPINIKLIEAAPRLLPRSPEAVSRAVAKRLERCGVTIMCGKTVQGQTSGELMVDGEPIRSSTVIWTAGVTNHPFFKANNFKLNDRGRVVVDEYLQAEPGIYVLGDNADTPYSGLAQTALYDGGVAARNIIRSLSGARMRPYRPKRPIIVTPVGKRWASVEWGGPHFTGLIGWLLRHLADLRAFSEVQSWPKAGKQWLTTISNEDLNDCPNC